MNRVNQTFELLNLNFQGLIIINICRKELKKKSNSTFAITLFKLVEKPDKVCGRH